jgi:hypothetical protein
MNPPMSFKAAVSLPLLGGFFLAASMPAAEVPLREIVVTNDLILAKAALLSARLIVRASHVTIDGAGATLTGPGQTGDLKSFEEAGAGILIDGATDVTLKNLKARGFATGLVIRQARAVAVMSCDFSDNYHNPKHGWGELPARGGILVSDSGGVSGRESHKRPFVRGISEILPCQKTSGLFESVF